MTEKLYYTDSFMTEFTAAVLSCEQGKEGWQVVLDRTAFYPEGGGQPADHGTLGGARVTDVREKEGLILHTCDKALAVGESVTGVIDWARRFDHMQQHSGEHVVSGIICARYGCDNVGFHLGKDMVTIDFNHDIDPADLPAIEAQANAFLWSDTPIHIRFLEGEALKQAEYRSKKYIPGLVRLVAFPGADCCACCGTHVNTAGQVGLVKLLFCQKFREGVRIELLCGKRAFDYLSSTWEQNLVVSRALSAKPMQTAAAVERLQGELESVKLRCADLETADCARKAREYAGKGDVLRLEGPMSADSVRRLCDAVLDTCGGRCAVFAGEADNYKYAIGTRDGDVRPLVKELNAALNGRGGGKPNFAQGSVVGDQSAIKAFFE
ncbi:MAG: alanyl-tRNA editing protein [Clostridia bacterium]|nr:alanyl-tRNA editing protein [Clostridia bacterium]